MFVTSIILWEKRNSNLNLKYIVSYTVKGKANLAKLTQQVSKVVSRKRRCCHHLAKTEPRCVFVCHLLLPLVLSRNILFENLVRRAVFFVFPKLSLTHRAVWCSMIFYPDANARSCTTFHTMIVASVMFCVLSFIALKNHNCL